MQAVGVGVAPDGLLVRGPCFVQAIQESVELYEVAATDGMVRVETEALPGFCNRFLILPQNAVAATRAEVRNGIPRIGLGPYLADLNTLLHLPGSKEIVCRRNEELLCFRHAIPQLERLTEVLDGFTLFSQNSVHHSKVGVGHCEVRVQFNGLPKKWNRLDLSVFVPVFYAQAVGF